jgi:hypothetical protein
MAKKRTKSSPTFAVLMHESLNDITTVMGIAQLSLITKELPSDVRRDMKRIVETSRSLADKLKLIAEVLQEED